MVHDLDNFFNMAKLLFIFKIVLNMVQWSYKFMTIQSIIME